jgi:hypothetical protein
MRIEGKWWCVTLFADAGLCARAQIMDLFLLDLKYAARSM